MTIAPRAAFVAGVFEHPGRELPDLSVAAIHAEVAIGAIRDAGLSLSDVDGYFCSGDTPGQRVLPMVEHLGLRLRHVDSTDIGGASYLAQVAHAAQAIAAGACRVALIVMGGKPRTGRVQGPSDDTAQAPFENVFGPNPTAALYALAAARHMHEHGTTSAQLAEITVAASHHAQHNPNALLRSVVTVEEVLDSPLVADPLHRLDCCVITDGGGAAVVVAPEVAARLQRQCVPVLGFAEAVKHNGGGRIDLSATAAAISGPAAFEAAGVSPADIDYASIYDSFTITVLQQIEDLGFCPPGQGGAFVADGGLRAPHGRLPFNTDGGGLRNNHPANRGGMTKLIEAVRQLRGEAHPAVQVPDCELAVAQGMGGALSTRSGSATLILGRD